jgi:hypothetical protein
MAIAGDGVVLPMPKTTVHFDNVARKFPTLPLRDELDRLCRTFHEEALSALGGALRQTVAGRVKRGRPSTKNSGHPDAEIGGRGELRPATTKQFDLALRKYPALPLRDELEQLCRFFPADALAALADALRLTVSGHMGRRRPRLEGLGGPPAHIRGAVQVRRQQGLSNVQIARQIADLLPQGLSADARRVRARREVANVPESASKGVQVSFAAALALWAEHRAVRQLNIAIRRGLLTLEQAERRLEERKSRFMSRAEGKHPR